MINEKQTITNEQRKAFCKKKEEEDRQGKIETNEKRRLEKNLNK